MTTYKKKKEPFSQADTIISEFPLIKVSQYDQKEESRFFSVNFLKTKGNSPSHLYCRPINKQTWKSTKSVIPDDTKDDPLFTRKCTVPITKLTLLPRSLSSDSSPSSTCIHGGNARSFLNHENILNDFIDACDQLKKCKCINTRTIDLKKRKLVKSQSKLSKIIEVLNIPTQRKGGLTFTMAKNYANLLKESNNLKEKAELTYEISKMTKLHHGKLKIWKMASNKFSKHSIH